MVSMFGLLEENKEASSAGAKWHSVIGEGGVKNSNREVEVGQSIKPLKTLVKN